jgi:nitrous oxide reductase accessory protein NosL
VVVVWLMLFGLLQGGSLSSSQEARLFQMGKKVADSLCHRSQLEALDLQQPVDKLSQRLQKHICHDLNERYTHALLHYLHRKAHNLIETPLHAVRPVPTTEKCPVCGMYPYKYPDWAAMMIIGKKCYYFDGVKDMMVFYLLREKYHYDRASVTQMVVQDFYRLSLVDATLAWYVLGSDIRGPMGPDLIPFARRKDAQIFLTDHHGSKIIRFDAIRRETLAR